MWGVSVKKSRRFISCRYRTGTARDTKPGGVAPRVEKGSAEGGEVGGGGKGGEGAPNGPGPSPHAPPLPPPLKTQSGFFLFFFYGNKKNTKGRSPAVGRGWGAGRRGQSSRTMGSEVLAGWGGAGGGRDPPGRRGSPGFTLRGSVGRRAARRSSRWVSAFRRALRGGAKQLMGGEMGIEGNWGERGGQRGEFGLIEENWGGEGRGNGGKEREKGGMGEKWGGKGDSLREKWKKRSKLRRKYGEWGGKGKKLRGSGEK